MLTNTNIMFYIICLSSLDIGSSKKWLIYINQSIQTSTQQSSSDMADRLIALRYQTELLGSWCNLPSSSDIDVNHTLAWSPCGAVQYVTMQMRNAIQWQIKVNFEFVIDIYFHVFHIDASGKLCLHSALTVYGNHASPKFCGKRKPWSELVDNHVATIAALQIDVIKPMQLSFTYSVLDPIDMRQRVLQSKANIIKTTDKPKQSLTYEDISKLLYLQIWLLEAPIGKVIAVTFSSLDVFNHLSIFEGFGRHHPANNGVPRSMEAKLINYYVATIYLHNDMILDSTNFYSLTFWHLNLTTQPLLPSSIRVHNVGGIYYKILSIKTKPGSFPNVSFHVQRFDGWNEGGCTYGGFLFKQFLNDSQLEPQTLGPYCAGTEPSHPLTGTDGLDYLVFGDSTVDLIIYANGPFYAIDMEVVVSESSCVGVVSPIWLCSFVKNETHAKYFVKFLAFSVICDSKVLYGRRKLAMDFVNISKCIVVQNIGSETTDSMDIFSFAITLHLHFRLTIKLKKNFLLPHQDNIHANWGFMYNQDNRRVVYVFIKSTTVLSKQHVSFVSHTNTPFTQRVYYTYSLLVVPRAGKFSCVDTQMSTHNISEPGIDLNYLVNINNVCGAGVYNYRGKYLLWFRVNSITPQMMFLQVITSSCQHSYSTHDVLFACHDATSCYAVDLLDKVFHLYSTLMKTMYTYERTALCSTFIIEYNFVRYNIIATMLPHYYPTIHVRMFTKHTQHFM